MTPSFFFAVVGSCMIGYNTNGWIGLGVFFCLLCIDNCCSEHK